MGLTIFLGGGGGTLPPLQFIFPEGTTPHPKCRSKWGVPPPLPVPAGPINPFPENLTVAHPHADMSTRNTGCNPAEKVVSRRLGGRGVIPLPPHNLFFQRGSPPHPCAKAGGGTPSLARTDSLNVPDCPRVSACGRVMPGSGPDVISHRRSPCVRNG